MKKSDSLKSFSGLRYTGRLRPERDWLALLLISFTLLLASVAWNIWFFLEVANSENAAPVAPTVHTVSSAAAVTNVQNIFKTRAAEQENYQQTYHFVDPSLSGS